MGEEAKDVEAVATPATEQKEDVVSVDDTKSVNTATDHESEASVSGDAVDAAATSKADEPGKAESPKNSKSRMLALLTILIIVIGLAVGLGVGLGLDSDSAFSMVHSRPCNKYGKHPGHHSSSGSMDSSSSEDLEDPEVPSDSKYPVDGEKHERLQWPELVGMPGKDAEALLIQWYGDAYNIVIVPFGGYVTKDYRTDRIFLFLDEDGNVMLVPQEG